MESDDGQNTQSNERALKNALHFACGKICQEEESSTQISLASVENNPKMSKKAIGALTELSFHYAKCLSSDLLAFSKHAGRKTITTADIKLVARRNPRGLLDALEGFCDNQSAHAKEKRSKGKNKSMSTSMSRKRPRQEDVLQAGARGFGTRNDLSSSEDDLDLDVSPMQESEPPAMNFNIQVDESSSDSDSDTSNSDSDSSDESIQLKLKLRKPSKARGKYQGLTSSNHNLGTSKKTKGSSANDEAIELSDDDV